MARQRVKVNTIPEMPRYLSNKQKGEIVDQLMLILWDMPDSAFEKAAAEYTRLKGVLVTAAQTKLGAVISLAALGRGLPGDAERQGRLLRLQARAAEKLAEQQQEQGNES